MNHLEWKWRAADGRILYAQSWQPESGPRAVVCLVHGHGEHAGRYAHVGAALSGAGYALLGYDLRGHGQSEGQRGHTPSYEALLDDVAGTLQQAEEHFPGRPRFLYGHSLGSTLVLSYGSRRQPQLAGVVSSGALLHTPLEQQALKIALARLMNRLTPATALATGLDPETISRDPEVVRAYRNDPLVHDRITFRMASETLAAMRSTLAQAGEFSLPLLIMHGGADRLCFPEGSREFAAQVKSDCTLKIWDGLYHEIHNEPEKEQVLEFTIAWLDAHS